MASPERSTLLVIDDEPRIRHLLQFALMEDYHVCLAAGGEEGLSMTAQHQPDLVILDLLMPDMGGLEVCRALRTWYRRPILVLSALSRDQEIAAALDLGADDYLTKPFSPTVLLARVRALLRRAGQHDDLRTVITIGELTIDLPY